ncbi:epimerase [Microbacterium panaciterrae]|uniref:TIGR01777 family oxidoreductase n=1 Tax=Microbacterium panaciterrae TaxID=985759 RepID=A0ABP8PTZ6_9MICO
MSGQPRAVIGGGSGYLGRAIRDALRIDGYDVRTIGRTGADAGWDDPEAILRLVDGADLVIGLAGKRVDCRYTDRNRDEILRSRVETTRALHRAISSAERPPRVWMNGSSATAYRYALDRAQTEADGSIDTGFSPDITRAWEAELFDGELPGTRRIALRTSLVIGRDAPVATMLLRLARLGIGGPQIDGWWFPHRRYRGIGPHPTDPAKPGFVRSHGRQMFTWMHEADFVQAVRFLRDHEEIDGAVNMASPHAIDNRELMRTLRRAVHAPFGIPAWRFMLEPAMFVLGTETELVLKSRWVAPQVLLDAGFEFRYPDLEGAVREIVAG